mmetsp:Transcript_2740/g.7602  ORF Transcript_2740/g.7602 Transcript_2740/m.7602 type:complete len:428 (-) Transcript_2740:405-1688(-)
MAATGIGALDEGEEEEIFAYDYGEDFPESLSELGRTLLSGRPTNRSLGPFQQLKIIAVAAEYRAPTARRAGKGKMLPASDFEKEQEQESRKAAQKATQRLILPKVKSESSDAFIRRLDAHRQAPEAMIIPLTPPEDDLMFAKRMVAVKGNETPNAIILPKTPRESNQEFEERLECAKKTSCPLVFQRGAHESGAQFKTRITAQLKCRKPIIPRSADEPEKGFAERCKMQVSCDKVVHPFDPKREDEHAYFRRLHANREKTALVFEPGDEKAIVDAIGVEKKKGSDPYALAPAAEETGAEIMAKAEAEQEKAKEKQRAAEVKEEERRKAEEKEKEDEKNEAERVAQRIADMKAKAAEAQAAAELEANRKASFEMETINMSSIGFMPLKKLLMERGVPKEVVFGAPTKFALQEVAKKWGDELKVAFVTE